MAFSLIPKEEKFFDLLEEASENVKRGAEVYKELVSTWSPNHPNIQKIRDLEHDGDRMTHEMIDKLNRTFITPLDREDILALASELDDVIDILQATTDRMQLFRIRTTSPHLVKMADVLVKATDVIGKAIKSLRDLSHSRRTLDFCIEANRLENEGDALLKIALEELFAEPVARSGAESQRTPREGPASGGPSAGAPGAAVLEKPHTINDTLEIIKWKEIFEATEHATDKCEDIANVIEGIIVKNA